MFIFKSQEIAFLSFAILVLIFAKSAFILNRQIKEFSKIPFVSFYEKAYFFANLLSTSNG